jgi:hypothetical protein
LLGYAPLVKASAIARLGIMASAGDGTLINIEVQIANEY